MSFIKNVSGTFATKILYIFCGFFSGMITARWLGPHDRGILALLTALPATIWMLSSFGINQANVYYIGKKKLSLSGIISNAVIVPFVMGCVICTFLWSTRDYIILKYIPAINQLYLLLTLILVPVMLLQNSYLGILRGVEKFTLINLRSAVRTISGLFLVVTVLIIMSGGLMGMVVGIIIIEFLFTVWLLFEINRISRIRIAFDTKIAKKVFVFGIKSYFQNMIGFLHNRIDLFMVAYFLVPAQVAFYDISVILGEMLLFLPQTISFVLLPKLVKGSEKEKIDIATQTGRVTMMITVLFSILLIAAGSWLIEYVYGKDYIDAYVPLCLLVPGLICSSLNSVTIPYYTSKHKQKTPIIVSLISLISNIILNAVLIPLYGIKGAAISTSLTYSMFSLILLMIYSSSNNLSLRETLVIKRADINLLKGYFNLTLAYVKGNR